MAKTNNVTVSFKPEKITKNTVRFAEITESEFAAPIIGTLYVPKGTLGQIGYADGKTLTIMVSAS